MASGAARAAAPSAPLPDPATWHQEPEPVLETPPPDVRTPRAELGVDSGVVYRPSTGRDVHYGAGWLLNAHLRVDLFEFLAVRLLTGLEEGNDVSFDDGALGLPRGTHLDQPSLQRVHLGVALEPTWKPVPRLSLFAGVGINWGRTTAGRLTASGAETLLVPTRAAVYIELPLSVGARYEVIPDWLVVNLSGTVGWLTDQSGSLLSHYSTPGKTGELVTVQGFPEFDTSFTLLAGLGVLL